MSTNMNLSPECTGPEELQLLRKEWGWFLALGISLVVMGMIAIGNAFAAMLFAVVGMLYDRTHTRQIGDMSGLMHHTPLLGAAVVFAGLAALGLPTLAGFVAEITIFFGAFAAHKEVAAVALLGVLLAAGYVMWMLQRTIFGPRDEKWAHLEDAKTWWEFGSLGVLAAAIILLGVYPAIVMDLFEASAEPIARGIEAAQSTAITSVGAGG